MNTATAMSKIADIRIKGRVFKVYINEKKGRHRAPYVLIIGPDKKEIHIRIDNQDVYDNSDNMKSSETTEFQKELMESWESAKAGKAAKVLSGYRSMRVSEIAMDDKLNMILRMESGEIRILNFKKIANEREVFKPLLNPRVFKQAEAMGSMVHWESIDISMEVEALYDESKSVDIKKFLKKVS